MLPETHICYPICLYDISQHKVEYRELLWPLCQVIAASKAWFSSFDQLHCIVSDSVLETESYHEHKGISSCREGMLPPLPALRALGLWKSVLALTFTSSSFSFPAHEAFPYELITQETTSSLFGIHLGSVQSFKALTYNHCKTG